MLSVNECLDIVAASSCTEGRLLGLQEAINICNEESERLGVKADAADSHNVMHRYSNMVNAIQDVVVLLRKKLKEDSENALHMTTVLRGHVLMSTANQRADAADKEIQTR